MAVLEHDHDEFGHRLLLAGVVHRLEITDTDVSDSHVLMVELGGATADATALMDQEDVDALHEYLGHFVKREPVEHDTRLKVGGPDAVTVTVCDSCARTDRWSKLTDRHFSRAGLCPGPIRQVTYAREGK